MSFFSERQCSYLFALLPRKPFAEAFGGLAHRGRRADTVGMGRGGGCLKAGSGFVSDESSRTSLGQTKGKTGVSANANGQKLREIHLAVVAHSPVAVVVVRGGRLSFANR